MTLTTQDLVAREVHYCVSSLVSTLAQGNTTTDDMTSGLSELLGQAQELAAPIDDWEEAAIEAGWTRRSDGMFINPAFKLEGDDEGTDFDLDPFGYDDWRNLCDEQGLDPYPREVYEHWIVSEWLADKLEAKGEKVDRDFAGMVVWARTTSGQAIAADSVIEQILAELLGA